MRTEPIGMAVAVLFLLASGQACAGTVGELAEIQAQAILTEAKVRLATRARQLEGKGETGQVVSAQGQTFAMPCRRRRRSRSRFRRWCGPSTAPAADDCHILVPGRVRGGRRQRRGAAGQLPRRVDFPGPGRTHRQGRQPRARGLLQRCPDPSRLLGPRRLRSAGAARGGTAAVHPVGTAMTNLQIAALVQPSMVTQLLTADGGEWEVSKHLQEIIPGRRRHALSIGEPPERHSRSVVHRPSRSPWLPIPAQPHRPADHSPALPRRRHGRPGR